ncbi:MAG: sulfatase-like hydrolase/transferase [Cyclobacteriaceae bacterium]|nr:sulfatase-like hydrolase/transferase [Cyclobacteriaceae bacterium]
MKGWSLIAVSFVLFSCGESKTIDSPNVLFIMADDMGSWALGKEGSPNAFTPQLDKLADQGAVFTNFYSNSAVCSPARASLITGLYPSAAGILDVIRQKEEKGLPIHLYTLPQLFRQAGYETFLVGKWHLGSVMDHDSPKNRGYNWFTGFPHGGRRSLSPDIMIEDEWYRAEGKYTSDLLTTYALNYLERHNPKVTGKPFFMSLHYYAPHANTEFPEGMEPLHDGRSWLPLPEIDLKPFTSGNMVFPDPDFPDLDTLLLDRMTREYHASVHSIDRNMVRIIDFLKANNIFDNTIIIFTSDHGFMMGHKGLWHKGNGRWITRTGTDPQGMYVNDRTNLFEHSLKVPCIITWPDKIAKNVIVDQLLSFVDFFPTLLNAAGIEVPSDYPLPGKNFLPLLLGNDLQLDETYYAEYVHLKAYRSKNWKLVYDISESPKYELYNLSMDPEESNNMFYSDDPLVMENLLKLKTEWKEKIKAGDLPKIFLNI